MSSKLKDVFVLNETVVDKGKVTGGGPNTLSALGVNIQEVKSLGDLQEVIRHVHSRMMLGLKSVETKMGSIQDVPEEVKKALEDLQNAFNGLMQATTKGEPTAGWVDKTRGPLDKYRGNRSG